MVRLQKFLSDAGVASRRDAETMISDGRVSVNDEVVTRLPVFVDPQRDRVVVDGSLARPQALEHFILNKPAGVVCTSRDPAGRTRAIDLVPQGSTRLFIVGRLDASTTGLVLITNDGELAQRVTHARFGVPKLYRAEIAGLADEELLSKLRKGIYLDDGKVSATEVEIAHRGADLSVLHLTLRGGRDRLVRQMLARLGHRVLRLKRLQIGPISVKGLAVGAGRRLTPREVDELRAATGERRTEASARPRRPRPSRRGAGSKPAGATPRAASSKPAIPRKRRIIS